jgi:hypothetical protein
MNTVATTGKGISELRASIDLLLHEVENVDRKVTLLAKRAYRLIEKQRMLGVDQQVLVKDIKDQLVNKEFNLYQFIKKFN